MDNKDKQQYETGQAANQANDKDMIPGAPDATDKNLASFPKGTDGAPEVTDKSSTSVRGSSTKNNAVEMSNKSTRYYNLVSPKSANCHLQKRNVSSTAVVGALYGMLAEAPKPKQEPVTTVSGKQQTGTFFLNRGSSLRTSTTKRQPYRECCQPRLIIPLVVTIIFAIIMLFTEILFKKPRGLNCTDEELLNGIYDTLTSETRPLKPANSVYSVDTMCNMSDISVSQVSIISLQPLEDRDRHKGIPFTLGLKSIKFTGHITCVNGSTMRFTIIVREVVSWGKISAQRGYLQLMERNSTYASCKMEDIYSSKIDCDDEIFMLTLIDELYAILQHELNSSTWPPDFDQCLRYRLGY